MAMLKCKECDKEISDKASKCPSCGAHRSPSLSAWQIVLGILGAIGALVYFAAGGLDGQVDRNMAELSDRVAKDTVTQYQIAKRQGDPMQICVEASMVSAAYLQAKNESAYRSAKQTESADCKRAGMPAP